MLLTPLMFVAMEGNSETAAVWKECIDGSGLLFEWVWFLIKCCWVLKVLLGEQDI